MTKLLYAIAALLIVLAGFGTIVQTDRLRKAEIRAVEATKRAQEYEGSLRSLEGLYEAQKKTDKATQAALTQRLQAAQKQAIEARKEKDALQEALSNSREWADAPIPDGVRNLLAN